MKIWGIRMVKEEIGQELLAYNLINPKVQLIREKDGIGVYRIDSEGRYYVLKYFYAEEFRREIDNYKILQSLHIPTIHMYASTQNSILLEDINQSKVFRLGRKEDFENPSIIKALAHWYKRLHKNGESYANANLLYSQWETLTETNLDKIAAKFDLAKNTSYLAFMDTYPTIKEKMNAVKKTLIYQDFYYTNMVVSKDESIALMFDYNLLGKGSYITDILNVTYWFSNENKRLFIEEYGGIDQQLVHLEKTIAPFITLIIAMERKVYPPWAQEARNTVVYEMPIYLKTLNLWFILKFLNTDFKIRNHTFDNVTFFYTLMYMNEDKG